MSPLGRVVELRAYVDARDGKPFDEWLHEVNSVAAAKVAIALTRMEHGNFSNVKGVGSGVFEYRIHFGPG